MVFLERTCENSVLQDNVVKFLSSHKKYQIFGWECGPALLDHLYRMKKGNHPGYIKNGLILTHSIASVAAFVSLASKHRVAVTAAITFGVITIAAIDYQKTKDDKLIDLFELLRPLGETQKYWLQLWSSKISEVVLSESQKERIEIKLFFLVPGNIGTIYVSTYPSSYSFSTK